jgi:hypothetical protein
MSQAYIDFFLNGRSDAIQYEMLELSHSAMSQTWRLTRNAPDGIVAGGVTWQYCPMDIEPSSAQFDLDFGVQITLGDLGSIVSEELANIRAVPSNYGMLERPQVVYQTFDSSSDMTAPLAGPFSLEIVEFALTRQGSTFTARPLTVNRNKTGMLYTVANFPSLKGFL